MCALSMIMDHKGDEWNRRLREQQAQHTPYVPMQPLITQDEIAEFRRLLERAREYDRKNNEPDCEMEEKRQRLRDLAKEMGVGDIAFV